MSRKALVAILLVLLLAGGGLLLLTSSGSDRPLMPAAPDAVPTSAAPRTTAPESSAAGDHAGALTLTGRVVAFGTARPVAGATVTAAGSDAKTGSDGRFSLAGVPTGTEELKATAEGYRDRTEKIVVSADSTDVGDISLRSPTVLSVTVLDPEAHPVPGASVRLLSHDLYRSGSMWSGPEEDQIVVGTRVLDEGKELPGERYLTDAKGTVRVEGLAPGAWYACASAKGFAAADQDSVELPSGGEAQTEIHLQTSVSISGTVLDIRRRPAPGARVFALSWRDAARFPFTVSVETASAGDGSFSVDGLLRGTEYLVFARTPDGQIGIGIQIEAPKEEVEIVTGPRIRLVGSIVDDETGEPIEGARIYTVLAHAVSDKEGKYDLQGMVKSPFFHMVWLQREGYAETMKEVDLGGGLFGSPVLRRDFRMKKQKYGRVRVTVRDETGRPVPDAEVTAAKWGEKPYATAVTDSGGEAVLTKLEAGGARIAATRPGYVQVDVDDNPGRETTASPSESKWVRVAADDEAEVVIDLATTTEVSGVVHDSEGKPLKDVGIRAGDLELTATDADGKFRVSRIPKGYTTSLYFEKAGYAPNFVELRGVPQKGLDVQLDRGAVISGTLVDDAGKPVIGANVAAVDADRGYSSASGRSGPGGAFTLGGLRAGTWVISAAKEGYAPVRSSAISLAAGAIREDVRLTLTVGVEVTVEIVGPDGTRVPGGVVFYGPLDRSGPERLQFNQWIPADEARSFRMPVGRYRVMAAPADNGSPLGAVEVEKEVTGAAKVRISLPAEALRVIARITAPEGARIFPSLQTEGNSGPRIGRGMSRKSDTGRWESAALLPGKYHLRIYYQKAADSNRWEVYDAGIVEPGPDVIEVKIP